MSITEHIYFCRKVFHMLMRFYQTSLAGVELNPVVIKERLSIKLHDTRISLTKHVKYTN